MRLSKLFAPTLRDVPAEAEIVSHRLMLRAGMLRKIASGVYSFLPLGLRVLAKVERIVREEMDAIGAQEVLMPALQPAELWQASGRWQVYGHEMMRLRDRHEREFCLGPTHEELVTTLAKEARSYKELPLTLYQIQVKFRDEIRPRFGVMRSREFIMKDAYSFHANEESLAVTYADMHSAYSRIATRMGLDYRCVKAASGLIGGAVSEEFHVLADSGEDEIIYCPNCDYAANAEMAVSKWHLLEDEAPKPLEKISTPGLIKVAEVAAALGVPESKLAKTLVYRGDAGIVAVVVPGNKEVNQSKLESLLGYQVELLPREDFSKFGQLTYGYVGPCGLQGLTIIGDLSLKNARNLAAGANEADYHFVGVNAGRDFQCSTWADVVFAQRGEVCDRCGEGTLDVLRGIEVGHIFQLGTKYSEKLKAEFIDENGQSKPFIMGCYGIGISRLVAATIEQSADERGIIWPMSTAPYQVQLIRLGAEEGITEEGDALYEELSAAGFEVLYDDRKASAGVKFTDADLIGVPIQLVVGKKFLASGLVEAKMRVSGDRFEIGHHEILGWVNHHVTGELERLRQSARPAG